MTCTLFFFSSRRRHTRWPRDWSSDVCLPICAKDKATGKENKITVKANSGLSEAEIQKMVKDAELNRSEERRVGKECRCRWWAWDGRRKGGREHQRLQEV